MARRRLRRRPPNSAWLAWWRSALNGTDGVAAAIGAVAVADAACRPIASRTIARSSCSVINRYPAEAGLHDRRYPVDDADDGRIDGVPLRPTASAAARPSITTRTLSFTPAPTASTASSATPRGVSSSVTGWTSSSCPFELPVLLGGHDRPDNSCERHDSVSQWSTMPTTPASAGTSSGRNGKLASFPRTKNTVSPTRHPPRPRRRASARPAVRRRRSAAGSKRPAVQVVVLPCDDHIADHGCKLHQSPADTSTASTIPTIAASTGQSFNPAAIRAELPLTISTVSPTPASTVSTATGRRLLLFRGVHRTRDQQLAADQPRIFPRRHDGSDDTRENHPAGLPDDPVGD